MPFITLYAAYMFQWRGTVKTRNPAPTRTTQHESRYQTESKQSLRAAELLVVAGGHGGSDGSYRHLAR
jgi:hypothetical protein